MKIRTGKYYKVDDLFLVGVYFLFRRDKLIYIGKSTNFINRIVTHHLRDYCDMVRFIPCSKKVLDYYEMRWIKKFAPQENLMGNPKLPPAKTFIIKHANHILSQRIG